MSLVPFNESPPQPRVEWQGSRFEELALVYYQTDKSRDPKGWIFLKDINEITEDGEAFKIASYARYCLRISV